jgi:hypothetical protein
MSPVRGPLFRDPIFDGAADPTVIWNRGEKAWWILYTNRRANVACEGVTWVHGTDIGIASSADGGGTWLYRGILEGLQYEPGRNTYWAPEVLWHEGLYHMYVSYVPGVPRDWKWPRYILHYTSVDLWKWEFRSKLELSSNKVIDACVHLMPGGKWRMWYKDEAHGSLTWAAESSDLYSWKVVGPVITARHHEGPNVFQWKGFYWMVTDEWQGQRVYRSDDAETWSSQERILDKPGKRGDDGGIGLHADVLVCGERAFIFYFTHPDRTAADAHGSDGTHSYASKRSSIQAAELEVQGGVLVCDRDKDFVLDLTEEKVKSE